MKVEARMVPFPGTISAEARAHLVRFVDADGNLFAKPLRLAPSDLAGWGKAQRDAAAMLNEVARLRSAHLTSTVETIELAGCVVHEATPRYLASHSRVYLDIHGGALVHGGGEFCKWGARRNADLHGVRSYAVDYRMPPEYPYPAALDDCVAVYRALLGQYGEKNIVIGGASAGGNLVAALVLRARDEGLPPPAGVVMISPELDLTESGDSFAINQTVNFVLGGTLESANLLYAGGNDLSHPYLSPLFGDFTKGFAPSFIQAGTRDLFLSNAARMHRALRKAGIAAELHVFEGMPHGGFSGAPEDRDLEDEVKRFVKQCWDQAN